jgi:hypothetical protein
MDTSFESNKQYLQATLGKLGMEVTPEAWKPLKRINFRKLVRIHDHEEAFLRRVFVESLKTAHALRTAQGRGTKKVNGHDVATAMLMLGAAVANASDASIEVKNKALVKSVCPYC